MPDNIPPVDPDLENISKSRDSRREQLEYELLEAEAAIRSLVHREISQRYIIKWVAVITGVLVIFGMALALYHFAHNLFLEGQTTVSPSLSIVMFVAPVLSITTITVALFVGAFRKFEEKDLESVGSGVTSAASLIRGG